MMARVSAMSPPQKGSEGWIENFGRSIDEMLREIHTKYGDKAKRVPQRFDIEDVYRKFEDYYKKALEEKI